MSCAARSERMFTVQIRWDKPTEEGAERQLREQQRAKCGAIYAARLHSLSHNEPFQFKGCEASFEIACGVAGTCKREPVMRPALSVGTRARVSFPRPCRTWSGEQAAEGTKVWRSSGIASEATAMIRAGQKEMAAGCRNLRTGKHTARRNLEGFGRDREKHSCRGASSGRHGRGNGRGWAMASRGMIWDAGQEPVDFKRISHLGAKSLLRCHLLSRNVFVNYES